jgi:phosphoribosylanthranilate isomerase
MSPPRRPDVKICGVCDPVDAAMAVESGASHVGVIRTPGSPRARPLEVARSVCAAAAGARKVGVYVDAPVATILQEAELLGLDVVQLHGSEGPEHIPPLAAQGLEVWKVVKPERAEELLDAVRRYRAADMILVEGHSDRGHGGVGARFPWGEIAAAMDRVPVGTLLGVGGGLNPDNVAGAVRRFRPALVDVSSGVEGAPCRKDPDRVRAFITAARRAAMGPAGTDTDRKGAEG